MSPDSMETAEGSSQWPYLLGAFLGLASGVLIAADFLISNYLQLEIQHLHVLRRIPIPTVGPGLSLHLSFLEVPYIFSVIIILCMMSVTIFFINFEKIWRQRFKILVILVVVSYHLKALLSLGRADIGDLTALLFLALWLLHLFMDEREGFTISPVFFLLLALYGSMLLSTVNGKVASMMLLIMQMKNLILFLILSYFLREKDMFQYFVKILVVITAISSIIGIAQEALYLYKGLVLVRFGDARSIQLMFEETSLGTLLRVPAFLGPPQDFANTLCIVSTIVFYLILRPELKIFKRHLLLWPIFSLIVVSLILTFSRGALLAFLLASTFVLYLNKPSLCLQISAALASILLIGVLGAILKPSLMREMMNKVSSEFSYKDVKIRNELVQLSLTETMRRHPFIGIGIGQGRKYTHHVHKWPAHNAFILALAEVGFVGFLLYSMAFVVVLTRLIFVLLVVRDEEWRSMTKLLLAGYGALILDLQVDPFFLLQFVWIYWGMVEGLTSAALRGHRLLPAASLRAVSAWLPEINGLRRGFS